MTGFILAKARPLLAATVVGAVFGLSPPGLTAQEVQFVGNTQGCFGGGCTPMNTDMVGSGTATVVFTAGAFDGTTEDGILAIQGSSGDLGMITVGIGDGSVSSPFTLLVNFTVPDVLPPEQTFSALLSGQIASIAGDGGVSLDFDPGSPVNTNALASFSFSNGGAMGNIEGTFDLLVQGLFVPSGSTAEIRGLITVTQLAVVPEPLSMTLLATGLLGLGGVGARRRRKALAD